MPRIGDPITVLVVDDHHLFRQGLRDLLGEQEGIEVVGEAAGGEAAVGLAASLAPDVVVMDLFMPGMSGVEATLRIGERAPASRVAILSASVDDAHVIEAITAGACGCLPKEAPVEQIVAGVRAVAAGESLVSPWIAAGLLEALRERDRERRAAATPTRDPSERELEVLRLLAAGAGTVEIARRLAISPKTVKSHLSNTLAKLHMDNRIEAAVRTVRGR